MFLPIPDVLKIEQLQQVRKWLDQAEWMDGRTTAGSQAASVKQNKEARKDHPAVRQAQEIILAALGQSKLFAMAALPFRISSPLFNRYGPGQAYGPHVDNAIRAHGQSLLRGDLSATLFLSDKDSYEGGELAIGEGDSPGLKLPAGHLVLYPADTLHHVKPVQKGERSAAFFWVQSLVRDHAERGMLLDLDLAIQRLMKADPKHPTAVQLTRLYQNLLRKWAET